MQQRDVIGELARWFLSECDGDWEHSHHVEIGTTDNPGWNLVIAIQGTELESRPFERKEIRRSDRDYVECWRTHDEFEADCGPLNVSEAIAYFLDWANRNADEGTVRPESRE